MKFWGVIPAGVQEMLIRKISIRMRKANMILPVGVQKFGYFKHKVTTFHKEAITRSSSSPELK